MMNKLKKLYRDFFGLTEAIQNPNVVQVNTDVLKKDPKILDTLTKAGKQPEIVTEKDLDEAQLINNIIDYRGGVEYVLRNPAEAESVAAEIREWATKKGFTVVKQVSSPTGKVGYFYFRLGQDPARESQRIQGYIAQKPEIKHFRFNVRGEKKPAPAPAPQQPAPENF
jgi:hypothetical protein